MVKIQANSQGKVYLTSNNKVLLTSGGTATRYDLSINDIIGPVDSNGVMEPPENISGITFDDVVTISNTPENKPAISMSYMGISGIISFPNLTTIENHGLENSFMNNNITSVSMPNLTTVGDYGLYRCFYYNPVAGTVDLGNLTTVGYNGLQDAFYKQDTGESVPGITGVDFSNLTTVSNSGLRRAFYNQSITSLDLSSLTTIGYYGLYSAFQNNPITSVDLSGITSIGAYGLSNAFYRCKLTTVNFASLSSVGSQSLSSAFYRNEDENWSPTLETIYFPALTPHSFDSADTGVFNGMISGAVGCTVHFPFDIESVIGSWSDVLNGFGGTSTTVLFDLGRCTVTFDVTPNSGNQIAVNGEVLTDNTASAKKGSTINYTIYNSTYGLYMNSYNVPNTDTATATVDITGVNYNTIIINVGVTGLTVICQIDGVIYTCTESSTGIYTLTLYNGLGNDIPIQYYVNGGDYYTDADGTITFSGSDVAISVSLTPATSVQFIRPNLTENGTMGENDFAVESSDYSMSAYRVVDGDPSNYINIYPTGDQDVWFEFYNPIALKVSQLDFTFGSSSRAPRAITIKGSDDSENWTNISNWSGTPATSIVCTIPMPKTFKYYRLVFTLSGDRLRFNELGITATYKQ